MKNYVKFATCYLCDVKLLIQHTQKTASGHQLVGWVQNTGRGTVVGVVQGPQDKVNAM